MENGATRNFEAFKKLSEQIAKEKQDKDDEEANNPMKVQNFLLKLLICHLKYIGLKFIFMYLDQIFSQALENRTRDSKREMESIEKLEELKDLNTRLAKSESSFCYELIWINFCIRYFYTKQFFLYIFWNSQEINLKKFFFFLFYS